MHLIYGIRPFIAGFGDTPGEKVEVTFVGTTYPTTVGADGEWDFGKGAEFYSHSPIFWVKMLLAAVMGASSFFPTAQIIKRAVVKSKSESGEREPMSEALAKRMTSVVNAELLALSSIPLTASLMTRGVGYTNDFPWQAGAAPAFLALFGLGYKYINEALTWEEPMAVEN